MDTDETLEPLYFLLGHQNNVCALDSGHGLIVSGSWDKTARVWKDGALLYELKGHEQAVWAVLVLSKSLILTGSADKTIKLWENGKLKRTYQGHSDAVRGLAKLSDSSFVSCSNDTSVRIWDLENETQALEELYGHNSFVYSVTVDPSTGDIISAGEDRTFRVWRHGDAIQVVTLPYVSAWSVSVNPDNGDIAVGGSDYLVRIFTRSEERYAPEEDRIAFAEAVSSSGIGKDQVGNINKENIAGEEGLLVPGKKEGEIKMILNPHNNVEAYQWSAESWVKIGEVVGTSGSSSKTHYNGADYDYVFTVEIQEGAPPLKLPYNVTENPYDAARRFLENNELPLEHLNSVANFIEQNAEGVDLTTQRPASDPYGSRYVPGGGSSSASKPSSASASVPESLKVVPVKTYVQLISFKAAPIIKAIRSNNEIQEASNTLSEDDISVIEKGLNSTPISEDNASLIFNVVSKGLNSWSPSDTLPLLDVLRIIIPTLRTFPPVVMLQYLLSSLDAGVPKHCLLALRGLTNLFSSPNPGAIKPIDNKNTRATIFAVIHELLELGSKQAKPEAQNLAISSLCYNIAVMHVKKCDDMRASESTSSSDEILTEYAKFFPYMTDSESRYRFLLAAGTLMVTSGPKGRVVVGTALQKYDKTPIEEEERFKNILSDIKQLVL